MWTIIENSGNSRNVFSLCDCTCLLFSQIRYLLNKLSAHTMELGQVACTIASYPGFWNIKRLGIILLYPRMGC